MAWFDAVKKEIDDAVQLMGRGRTAKKFKRMMPQKYAENQRRGRVAENQSQKQEFDAALQEYLHCPHLYPTTIPTTKIC